MCSRWASSKKDEIFYAQRAGRRQSGDLRGREDRAATASTARPWRRPSSPRNPSRSGPTCRWAIRFMEKLLLEACLEAMQTGAIVGIQDMGAAGLTCSTCEMGSRGGTGIEIDLDLRAAARNRHDAVRDHALGIAGAHAAGGRKGPRRRSFSRVPQVGPGRGDDRHGHRRRTAAREASWRGCGRDSQSRTGGRSSALRSAA